MLVVVGDLLSQSDDKTATVGRSEARWFLLSTCCVLACVAVCTFDDQSQTHGAPE